MDDDDSGIHTNELPHDHPLFDQDVVRNPSKIYVWGTTTPPASTKSSKETPHVTLEDMQDALANAIGRPILQEHKAGVPLARVIKAKPNEKNQIFVVLEIEDTVDGRMLEHDIRAGKFTGFSWGGRHAIADDPQLVKAVTQKKHVELSVTDSPEFEDAKIEGITPRAKGLDEARKKLCDMLHTESGRQLLNAPQFFGKCKEKKIFFIQFF